MSKRTPDAIKEIVKFREINIIKEIEKFEQMNKIIELGINLEKLKDRAYTWYKEYQKGGDYLYLVYNILKVNVKRKLINLLKDEYNKVYNNMSQDVKNYSTEFDVDSWAEEKASFCIDNWWNYDYYITRGNFETEAMLKFGDFILEMKEKNKNG